MTNTKYYALSKPDYTDVADIAVINNNMDIVDEKLNTALSHTHTFGDDDLKGILSVSQGGTGATNKNTARSNLGCGEAAERDIDTIVTADSENLVESGTIYTALAKKSDTSHTHALTDSAVTGVLPISKGGTGSTTVASARTALGLGTAAQQNYTNNVTADGTALPTSQAVYTALANAKSKTHIVVATSDTKNPLKANADYTCTATNASSVLKTAIENVANGGRIELLDGTYNLQYDDDVIEISKSITIEGSGYNTVINQPSDTDAGEAKSIFKITAINVTVKNMKLNDAVVSSPVQMVEQAGQGAIYNNVFFIFNASEITAAHSCIKGTGDCAYTRIQNCRVWKGFKDSDTIMFDFSNCTSFSGVLGANISSGYDNISIKFANDTHKNNTIVYGHLAVDIK